MPHILIVEDEPSTSWALAEGLSEDGFTIDTFRTAEEACVAGSRRAAATSSSPTCRLPGHEWPRPRAQAASAAVNAQPVIIVTAYGTPEVLRDLHRAGVSDCFPKPFPIDMLRRSGASRRSTPPASASQRAKRSSSC